MDLKLSPEDVDAFVKEAILKAGLGKMLTEAVAKAFSAYNNPIDESLKRYVGEVAGELIRTKFSEQIRAAVAAHIEANVTQEILEKTTAAAVEKMVRAAQESRW